MNAPFIWWHANGDGTATAWPDTREVRARVDAGEPGWYGTIEGAILHGGVIATAFERYTVQTFDAMHYFATGEHKPMGEVTTTKITAEAKL
jgi:hypothetical protein